MDILGEYREGEQTCSWSGDAAVFWRWRILVEETRYLVPKLFVHLNARISHTFQNLEPIRSKQGRVGGTVSDDNIPQGHIT